MRNTTIAIIALALLAFSCKTSYNLGQCDQLFLDLVRRDKLKSKYQEQLKFELKEDVMFDDTAEILKEKCEKALRNLSEKERIVFLMNKKDGLKYKEIAKSLKISIKAIEKRMSQALKKIKVIKNEK